MTGNEYKKADRFTNQNFLSSKLQSVILNTRIQVF